MIPMVAIIAIVEQRINKFIFFFSTACLALKEKEILFSEKILANKPTNRIDEYAIELLKVLISL